MSSESNSQISLFHLLFLVALVAAPCVGFTLGGRHFGWIGSALGLIIGIPVGVIFGYAPYWIVGKILKFQGGHSIDDEH